MTINNAETIEALLRSINGRGIPAVNLPDDQLEVVSELFAMWHESEMKALAEDIKASANDAYNIVLEQHHNDYGDISVNAVNVIGHFIDESLDRRLKGDK